MVVCDVVASCRGVVVRKSATFYLQFYFSTRFSRFLWSIRDARGFFRYGAEFGMLCIRKVSVCVREKFSVSFYVVMIFFFSFIDMLGEPTFLLGLQDFYRFIYSSVFKS